MANGKGDKASSHWYTDPNPLLDGIPDFQTPDAFLENLSFSPLAGLDVKSLSFMQRHELLKGEKTPLIPTTKSFRAAMTWFGMLRVGLQVRNPLRAEARRRYWSVLNAVAANVREIPRSPTPGIAVHIAKGPTGTAKTVTARRFCTMLGRQRIDHGAMPAAGWNGLHQLVYLYTDLSHDGSRGGFLIALLSRMDEALGTTSAIDLPRQYRTVERLAVATVVRLIAHYTGIIFIDEGQLRNLMNSNQADVMQLFLLSLMNSGIPLVLLGNERAFDWISFSQDLTRLNVVPSEYFHPVGAIDHPDTEQDWNALETGITSYYLLNDPPIGLAECKRLLRDFSGGIGRIGLTVWTSAQTIALYAGRPQLTPDDLRAAYEDDAFRDMRQLADGFSKRLPELLLSYPDVAVDYYAKHWNKPIPSAPEVKKPDVPGELQTAQGKQVRRPRRRSGPAMLKAEQTRKKNEDAARESLQQSLSSEDMRREGVKNLHLRGLDALRSRTNSQDT